MAASDSSTMPLASSQVFNDLLRQLGEVHERELKALTDENLSLRSRIVGTDGGSAQIETKVADGPSTKVLEVGSDLPEMPVVPLSAGGEARPTAWREPAASSEALVEPASAPAEDGEVSIVSAGNQIVSPAKAEDGKRWLTLEGVDEHVLNPFAELDLHTAFKFWAKHTQHMNANVQFIELVTWTGTCDAKKVESHTHPTNGSRSTQFNTKNTKRSSVTGRRNSQSSAASFVEIFDKEMGPETCMAKFVVNPGGQARITWDMMGGFLLVFDIIMIPMSLFITSRGGFIQAMDWITLVFWTCDMLASCLTGFIEHGEMVLDPKRILRNYLRTWFTIDVVVVGPDWTCTIIELMGSSAGGSSGKSGKLLRALRAVRMTRMVRLVKLKRVMTMIRDRIDSEHVFILAGVMRLLAMLMVVNHFLASIWYGVGDQCREAGLPNWIDFYEFGDKPIGDRYFASFHWSLTQFSPASLAIQPINVYERLYAITVLIFGLVLFSSFISSITASMTQLRTLDGGLSRQFWLLRRYLRQNGIANELSWRINRYVEYHSSTSKGMIPESKIWVLTNLSHQLRQELTYSVSFCAVNLHPLFEVTNSMSRTLVVRLADKTMSLLSFATHDLIIQEGVAAPAMYIIVSGEIAYVHGEERHMEDPERLLAQPDWACEHCLWTQWHTIGEICAWTECKLATIDTKGFSEVVMKEHSVWKLVSTYAKKFCLHLKSQRRKDLTDICRAEEMMPIVSNFIVRADDPNVPSAALKNQLVSQKSRIRHLWSRADTSRSNSTRTGSGRVSPSNRSGGSQSSKNGRSSAMDSFSSLNSLNSQP